VDLNLALTGFPAAGFGPANSDPTQDSQVAAMNSKMFNEGVNMDAVVTIPLDPNPTRNASLMLNDLKVTDSLVHGLTQPVVFATGTKDELGLVVASTLESKVLVNQVLRNAQGVLKSGTALALAHVDDRDLAVVGGTGIITGSASAALLFLVDVTDPTQPSILSLLTLDGLTGVGDILVKGTTAIVSGAVNDGVALLVDLSRPAEPQIVGKITGVASRLGLSDTGLLLSTDRSFLAGAPTSLTGLKTATLDVLPIITAPPVFPVNRKNKSTEAFDIHLHVVPEDTPIPKA